MNWESITIDVSSCFLGVGTFLLTIVCFIIVYKSLMRLVLIEEKSDLERIQIEYLNRITILFGICGVALFLMTIRLIFYGRL